MLKFIIHSFVLCLQVAALETCTRAPLNKRSYNEQGLPEQVLSARADDSLAIMSTINVSSTANEAPTINEQVEPQLLQHLEGLDNQTSPLGDNDLISLRVEYNKYKILSSLGIRSNPNDIIASKNYESLKESEYVEKLINDIKRTSLPKNVSIDNCLYRKELITRDIKFIHLHCF